MNGLFGALFPILLLVVVALVALQLIKAKLNTGVAGCEAHLNLTHLKARPVLTAHEQAMFHRVKDSPPGMIVMPQVAFSALMTHTGKGGFHVRNHFDRKRADFVVCNKGFAVLAVIELDDATHDGKSADDVARDAMLARCGYEVRRYRGIPDTNVVQADMLAIIRAKAAVTAAKPQTVRRRK